MTLQKKSGKNSVLGVEGPAKNDSSFCLLLPCPAVSARLLYQPSPCSH